MDSVRVRFAPSPTGHLHIGGLRSALFNWLFARHNKGTYLLRIEDTDVERSKPEYTQALLDAFSWTNILSDEPVVIQSHRKSEHDRIAELLLLQNKVYKCYCTQEEVIDRCKSSTEGDAYAQYDGLCRARTEPPYPNAPYVIRFKLPNNRLSIDFNDLVRGHVTFSIDQLDDFIIVRSDGTPMYNFVVVIDDVFMRITHVIRGEEHISNTPKQILLYEACGYAIPQFAHLSMILGPSGNKLSKRDAATSVLDYRDQGYLPDALINYLVRLGWSHGDQELFTRQEMIDYFSLEAVGKKGAIFSLEKLQWVNGQYIRAMMPEGIIDYIARVLNINLVQMCPAWHIDQMKRVIALYQGRVATLKELIYKVHRLYTGPAHDQYDSQSWTQSITAQTLHHIDQLIAILQPLSVFTHDQLMEACKQLSKQLTIKLVVLAQPIRIALTGTSDGPGVFDLMAVVGKDTCIQRLRMLRDLLAQ